MNKNTLNTLGLCKKAGAVICGTPMICKALQSTSKKPILIAQAMDVSRGTHKKLSDKSKSYGIKLVIIDCSGEELAKALGKTGFLAAVAVTDANFVSLFEKSVSKDLCENS